MTPILPIAEHTAFFAIAFFLFVEFIHVHFVSYTPKRGTMDWFMNRSILFAEIFASVSLVLLVWFAAIHDSQFAPHLITQSINGKILNQTWVTNNIYVKYTTESYYTNGQLSYYSQPHTNEYWHIWTCFKK